MFDIKFNSKVRGKDRKIERVYKSGRPQTRPFGYTVTSQAQLRALRRGAVPEGKVLNPHGKCGNTYRARYRATYFKLKLKPAWRPEAMKRKRLKMKEKKAIALEFHELQQIARENAVILDRAYGKASQTSITANVGNGKASDISAEELDKRVERALKRVEDLTNRTPKAGTSKNRPAHLRKLH